MTKPTYSADAAREIWGLACQAELTSKEQIQEVIDKHMARGDESMGEVVSLDHTLPEKKKWVAAAAIFKWFSDRFDTPEIESFSDDDKEQLNAIIDKYRPPEEKIVKMLAEACNKMAGFLFGWQDCLVGSQMTQEDFDRDSGVKEARAALAAYEKAKL